ncbi:hypothetical protein V8C86DRAFT_2444626 [Haematococcus lacustris]
MTEPTWQLLDQGAHHFQDSNPHVPITRDALDAKCKQSKAFEREWKDSSKPGRPIRGSFLYVIQQTAALKRAPTYGTLTLRTSTQNEAMDVWIGLVGDGGPKLSDIAMLVCWFQAPLHAVLQLNGASSSVMLNTIRTTCAHATDNIPQSNLTDELGLMNSLLPPRLNHLHLGVIHCLPGSLFTSSQMALLQSHHLLSELNLLQLGSTHCLPSALTPVTRLPPSLTDAPLNFLKLSLQWCHQLLGIVRRAVSSLQPALQLNHLLLGTVDSLFCCLQLPLQLGRTLLSNCGFFLGFLQPNIKALEL